MKCFLALLLAVVLLCSACLSATAEERQTTWNLKDLYADDAALEADIAAMQAKIGEIPSFRGTLNTVQNVADWYALADELAALNSKLYGYVTLKTSLDAGDGAARTLYGRVINLMYDLSEASAFANDEMFSQSDEFLDEVQSDERMSAYLIEFTRARKESAHLLPEEQEKLLLPLSRLTLGASNLYDALSNLELPRKDIVFPDGVTRKADENNYGLSLNSGFSQDFRKEYYETMMSAYDDFRTTYAQNFQNYLTGVSEDAKAHGYESALEKDLAVGDVELALYQAVIDASLEGSGLISRYAELMKRELGLSVIYGFDANLPIAPDPGISYTYDEACEMVLAALAPLGETYVNDAREALSGGWVDVYSAEGKASGAYSLSIRGEHPYMLINFSGTFSDVSMLAHELGHTMNQWYSDRAQPTAYRANPATIITEVASTLNELLLSDYMIQNAKTNDERKYYIAEEMSTLYSTFFTQSEFARFQQVSMEALERGEILTADVLDSIWTENSEKYKGGVFQNAEYSRVGWARIPHFYNGFYVYQYAAAISASCDIVRRIVAGEDGAVENYLTYIASGDPASTAQTLQIAGVDASNNDFINGLLTRFNSLMDEYEAIDAE